MSNIDLSLSNAQLNNSSSKMKYSFPKSSRFDNKRYDSPSPSKFYDLPDIMTKRGAGIGYGTKMDIGKQTVRTPAPSAYRIGSTFDLKKNEGITMSQGRDKIHANSLFRNKSKVPSPFDYNPEKYKKSLSYSISLKLHQNTDKWIKSVPGPGNYSHIQLTNHESKFPVSKFVSAPTSRFGRMLRVSEAELYDPKSPGPGQYQNTTELSKKFHSKHGYKIPNSKRPGMAKTNKVPGPGAYNRVSDFG